MVPASDGKYKKANSLVRNATVSPKELMTPSRRKKDPCWMDERIIVCDICLELMYKPYNVSPCSHKFCAACIITWSDSNETCPLCRCYIEGISKDTLVQQIIEQYLKKYPERSRPEAARQEADKLEKDYMDKLNEEIEFSDSELSIASALSYHTDATFSSISLDEIEEEFHRIRGEWDVGGEARLRRELAHQERERDRMQEELALINVRLEAQRGNQRRPPTVQEMAVVPPPRRVPRHDNLRVRHEPEVRIILENPTGPAAARPPSARRAPYNLRQRSQRR